MEPFASVAQYEARYGEADDEAALTEVLMDATREISAELRRAGIDFIDPSPEFADSLMQACRSMAYRAIGSGDSPVPAGATQYSQGAGGYTESYTLGNPYGEVYMSKAERRLLGIDRARIGFSSPGEAGR